jgi:hypothetical protein
MPSISDRQVDIGAGPDREAAGAERREATAAAPGILERLPDEMRNRLADELVHELLAGAKSEEEIVGPGGLLSQLTERLGERAMEVELTDHLGYESHQEPPGGTGNTRNGGTPKTLMTEHGPVEIKTPRTVRARLSRRSSDSASAGLRGSTRRFWRSTAAGYRPGISRRTCASSTA